MPRHGQVRPTLGEIASAFGIHVDTIEVPWGEPVTLDEIEASLKSVKYNAMVCQASETSTGTWLPIREIGALVQEVCPDTMFIVDGITAVGASDLHMDDWKIDVVVAGSQKAFMLPTGLSFVCLSEKAWKKTKRPNVHVLFLI
ncbi:MAG: aminotransferase class V-fold PLP-dependent enzyme [Bdellovibrionales bacterium]